MLDPRSRSSIRRWLLTLWFLVMLMVALGGITRLTGSGLSIVEWRPVSGALPPVGDLAWQQEFDAYKHSPQYRDVNAWMALADFKRIFFWEYVHRLLGRLIGLVLVLPWLYFVATGKLGARLARRTAGVFLWGGLQALVGWYMVKSGLAQEARVSHYRLALHLLLGMGVGQWIFWLALDLGEPRVSALRLPLPQRLFAWGFLHLLTLQVLYGAFMAGTHAGVLYSTFPDMNGRYSPVPFFVTGSVIGDLLQSPMAIHYVHRALALLVLAYAAVLALFLRGHAHVAGVLGVLLATLGLQLVLGALTAIWHVPVAWAVAHQVGAYLLVTAAVALCHKISGVTEALDAG